MDDTNPKIAQKMREMILMKSPLERIEMANSMHETSKYLITRSILEKNPHISRADLKKELFLRFYGNDFDLASQEKIIKHFEKLDSH
jgi:hypothetical protein